MTGSTDNGNVRELLSNLDRLHTTDLGIQRIKKNLGLQTVDDVVGWCRDRIQSPDSTIILKGKNWYISNSNSKITVNRYSYTIITAHPLKPDS